MKYVLAALVACACVAVIAVSAVWWNDRAASIEAAAKYKKAVADAEWARSIQECRDTVTQWDAGNKAPMIKKYGKFADGIVKNCRWMAGMN